MKIVKTSKVTEFAKVIKNLDQRMGTALGSSGVEDLVKKIITAINKRCDSALLSYTKKFDRVEYTTRTIKVSDREMNLAIKKSDPDVAKALKLAAKRINKFHQRQVEKSWTMREKGAKLGQIIRPLESVGLYVPGGKASYPSSVLMNAIPAKIAGIKRVVMTTPTPDGYLNPHVLLAAQIAGVDEIYKVGGAQAVAALALGTKTIASVVKIVGPGNVFVAEAKRQLFGKVDIDMIAGPSEILVLADDTANPEYIAADLLSQAEHDENAYMILVTPSAKLADSVKQAINRQQKSLKRTDIIKNSLRRNCYLLVTRDLDEAFDISNQIAPEHFELMIDNAEKNIDRVENAGALFVGNNTPEALGDYMAGPNHVLPTGGTAKFFSPLGVYDFVKRTSLLNFSWEGLRTVEGDVTTLAREENLDGHARAVEIRMERGK